MSASSKAIAHPRLGFVERLGTPLNIRFPTSLTHANSDGVTCGRMLE